MDDGIAFFRLWTFVFALSIESNESKLYFDFDVDENGEWIDNIHFEDECDDFWDEGFEEERLGLAVL